MISKIDTQYVQTRYDFFIITHLPSFYKINLFNRLAEKASLLVVFIAGREQGRELDFTEKDCHFDHLFLFNGDFKKRPVLSCLVSTATLVRKINYKKLIVSGWILIEFWMAVFVSPRRKNASIIESTIYDSKITGLSGFLKRMFMKRVSACLPSGTMHKELLDRLHFKGSSFITGGVGLMNHGEGGARKKALDGREVKRFLFVGRLIPEKNLELLIDAFSELPSLELSIAGNGEMEHELKKRSTPNIRWLGYLRNEELSSVYDQHDVFVLPSRSETWGLVVEEALNHTLPVIVSNRVGCSPDLVNPGFGYIFTSGSKESLMHSIEKIVDRSNYDGIVATVQDKYDSKHRAELQTNAYLNIL